MIEGEYLVCYDYGGGGIWAVMIAPSADAIRVVYPELDVTEEQPAWMDDHRYGQLREDPLRLDGAPTGILTAVLADRNRPSA